MTRRSMPDGAPSCVGLDLQRWRLLPGQTGGAATPFEHALGARRLGHPQRHHRHFLSIAFSASIAKKRNTPIPIGTNQWRRVRDAVPNSR